MGWVRGISPKNAVFGLGNFSKTPRSLLKLMNYDLFAAGDVFWDPKTLLAFFRRCMNSMRKIQQPKSQDSLGEKKSTESSGIWRVGEAVWVGFFSIRSISEPIKDMEVDGVDVSGEDGGKTEEFFEFGRCLDLDSDLPK